MPSRILPMDGLEQRSIMYWLPPGGRDNGVWATQWTLLAELEAPETAPILARLAEADIGAYAATASGAKARGDGHCRLYVDAMQYNQAIDALMLFLRGKQEGDLGGYRPAKPPLRTVQTPHATAPRGSRGARIAVRTLQGMLGAAMLAVLLAALYQLCVNWDATLHPHGPAGEPGIHRSAVPLGHPHAG